MFCFLIRNLPILLLDLFNFKAFVYMCIHFGFLSLFEGQCKMFFSESEFDVSYIVMLSVSFYE